MFLEISSLAGLRRRRRARGGAAGERRRGDRSAHPRRSRGHDRRSTAAVRRAHASRERGPGLPRVVPPDVDSAPRCSSTDGPSPLAAPRSPRSALRARSSRTTLGDVDWCWRLWLAGTPDPDERDDVGRAASSRPHPRDGTAGGDAPGARAVRGDARARRGARAESLARAFALSTSRRRRHGGPRLGGARRPRSTALVRPGRAQTLDGLALRPRCTSSAPIPTWQRTALRSSAARVLSDEQLFAEVGTIFGGSATATPEGERDPRSARAPRAARPAAGADPLLGRPRSVDGGAGDPQRRARARAHAGGRPRDRGAPRRPGADLPCPAATVSEDAAADAARPGGCRRDPGPGQRLVPGGAAERRSDRGRPVRPHAPRGAAASDRGGRAAPRAEPRDRPASPGRLLLLRQRAPARLLARHALVARSRDAGGVRRGSPICGA